MPVSVITVTPQSSPIGGSTIDQSLIYYYFKLAVAAGNYQPGGIPFSMGGQVFAPGGPVNVSITSISSPAQGKYSYIYNPNAYNVSVITNLALTSNVVTLTANNNLVATGGQTIQLNGLTTSTFLNGVTAVVTSATATSIVFPYTHANVSSGAETGTASLVVQTLPSVILASPTPTTGALQAFTGGSEHSTGATDAKIVADTIQCIATFQR